MKKEMADRWEDKKRTNIQIKREETDEDEKSQNIEPREFVKRENDIKEEKKKNICETEKIISRMPW